MNNNSINWNHPRLIEPGHTEARLEAAGVTTQRQVDARDDRDSRESLWRFIGRFPVWKGRKR